MVELIVSKADPVGGRPVPDIRIEITGTLPTWGSLGEWDASCDEQAERIEQALVLSLPGGVYDRLAGRMLTRKASHLRVAHEEASNG